MTFTANGKRITFTDYGPNQVGIYDDGTAEVQCWCTAQYVRVPLAEVRAGFTRKCSESCRLGGPRMEKKRGRKPRTGVNPADIWCVEHSTYAVACCGATVAKGGESGTELFGEVQSGTDSPSLGAVEED